ncbi:hypothetical protein BRADI_4g10982v3 [Brachypodium distachyon]|uniref:Uncharacterized protein n=1 Tax=Brachypodium distachyon TaxID=15368 RepID=A0A0Q3EI43_BRADI|nr:hypothetical protein BRADI_4g10982v3 [Brachypodium distachyon]
MGALASPPEQLQAPLISPAPPAAADDDHDAARSSARGKPAAPIIYLVYESKTSGEVEYSVAITSADGLLPDDPSPSSSLLSPVFNLTIGVKHLDKLQGTVCVGGGGSTAELAVSYHRAILAKDPAWPGFCVEYAEEREVGAVVWGVDVAVPRFLRERLARELPRGEAAFDVEVRDPGSWLEPGFACKLAKIGRGPYPCK